MNPEGRKILLQSLLSGDQLFAQVFISPDSDNDKQNVIIAVDDALFRKLNQNGLHSVTTAERIEHELSQAGVASTLKHKDELFINIPEARDALPKNAKSFLEMSGNSLIAAYRRNGLTEQAGAVTDFMDHLVKGVEKGRDIVVGKFAEYVEENGLEEQFPEQQLKPSAWTADAGVRATKQPGWDKN